MESPLVSIIIPSFNSERFIRETIDNVLKQTYDNTEIIVVDDGSTDNTTDLFEEFRAKGVHCFSIENAGASAARNFGLKKARGSFIQFLDSDDLLHPRKLELQLELMEKENAAISFTTWVNFTTAIPENPKFRFNKVPYLNSQSGKELMKSFGMNNWFIPIFSWLTSRELIEKAGDWNTNISNNDDGEFFARVLYQAGRVVCLDEIAGYYRVHPQNSLSKPNTREKINSALKSYKLIEELLSVDADGQLMAYPKRLYYRQFEMIVNDYRQLAKVTAQAFDSIKADCFLTSRKKYWNLINRFGLYRGDKIFRILSKLMFGKRS